MAKRNVWGQALTAIGLVGALAACSTSLSGPKSAATSADPSKVGMAMKAQNALAANDLPTAVALGEAAVEYRPNDANFRALLGNIYLASGRYASAEQSYRDALTLAAPDPQVVLKYALVQIGQGKSEAAIAMLSEAQSLLEPADLGLALALAGRASDAVAVLEPAARRRRAAPAPAVRWSEYSDPPRSGRAASSPRDRWHTRRARTRSSPTCRRARSFDCRSRCRPGTRDAS
jgi:tetratricopeptide (TPR) repeat protein